MANFDDQPTHSLTDDGDYLDEDTQQKALEARSALYPIIAQFRKNADQTENPEAQRMFSIAAEIIAGLSRAFRQLDES